MGKKNSSAATREVLLPSTSPRAFFYPTKVSASAPMPSRPRRPLTPPKCLPPGQMKESALALAARALQPAAPARPFLDCLLLERKIKKPSLRSLPPCLCPALPRPRLAHVYNRAEDRSRPINTRAVPHALRFLEIVKNEISIQNLVNRPVLLDCVE